MPPALNCSTAIRTALSGSDLDADRFDNLYALGIDEVSYKKGHNYVTLVVNHATGEPVWMGEGRSRASLSRFFDQLSPAQADKIQVVSMDMCAAYYEEVRARVPEAKICFDPFHVVKLANEACSEVRRTEARERKGTPHAAVLKGSRCVGGHEKTRKSVTA